jgi:hypothetical protein
MTDAEAVELIKDTVEFAVGIADDAFSPTLKQQINTAVAIMEKKVLNQTLQ